MRMRQLWMIVILIASAIVSGNELVFASPTTTLAAPIVVDKTLHPGSTFYINITVSEVQKLWGY
jgi:hypothetical protein